MLKKIPIIDFFKYHLSKIYRYFSKKITALFLLYFKSKLPQNLIDIMKNNRLFLSKINEFIPEHEYDPVNNNYGIQYHIYTKLNKEIDLFPGTLMISPYFLFDTGNSRVL